MLRSTLQLIALLGIACTPAHADLYRWVDPDTGSVSLSTLPPSDPRVHAELVPYRGAAAPPRPGASAGAPPKPAPPAEPSASVPELEARLHELSSKLAAATPQDLAKNGDALRQQLVAYEVVRGQLDRLDPAGAQRRAAEATALIERLRQR